MTHHRRHAADAVPLPAGRPDLCLDFANTLCWRGSAAHEESLSALPDLLAWLTQTAGVPDALTADPATWPEAHPGRAARLFDTAIALRETVFRLFSAVAAGGATAPDDLAALNRALADAPPRDCLIAHETGLAWRASPLEQDAATPLAPTLLAPVLWSAADLLVQGGEHRIRRCANEKCLWLFIDRSKAGTRRWCDMAACGNRAKSQRHYARSKGV